MRIQSVLIGADSGVELISLLVICIDTESGKFLSFDDFSLDESVAAATFVRGSVESMNSASPLDPSEGNIGVAKRQTI